MKHRGIAFACCLALAAGARAVLATRPRERIAQALTPGAMRIPARGLTAEQIEALADFLHE